MKKTGIKKYIALFLTMIMALHTFAPYVVQAQTTGRSDSASQVGSLLDSLSEEDLHELLNRDLMYTINGLGSFEDYAYHGYHDYYGYYDYYSNLNNLENYSDDLCIYCCNFYCPYCCSLYTYDVEKGEDEAVFFSFGEINEFGAFELFAPFTTSPSAIRIVSNEVV
ncbi:MAG: hypothetical protein FWC91_13790, partial [Defluviitaleaceae bacterium]|nr:hypothetical protein [Defluviitaleaceae bacterium]